MEFRAMASRVLESSPVLDYRLRIAIERAVFLLSKQVAAACLSANLHSLTMGEVKAVVPGHSKNGGAREAANFLVTAVELKTALAALASGDPYRCSDLAGNDFPGREGGIRALATAMLRCADRSERLLPESD